MSSAIELPAGLIAAMEGEIRSASVPEQRVPTALRIIVELLSEDADIATKADAIAKVLTMARDWNETQWQFAVKVIDYNTGVAS